MMLYEEYIGSLFSGNSTAFAGFLGHDIAYNKSHEIIHFLGQQQHHRSLFDKTITSKLEVAIVTMDI
jgi:hypothetical protein